MNFRTYLIRRITAGIAYINGRKVKKPDGSEQVMIILGAKMNGLDPSHSLQNRLDCAAFYAKAHPEIRIITTGGQGRTEIITEGEGMKQYLIRAGIEAERIFPETASVSTQQNFEFALQIMKRLGYDESVPILYVTNDYHLYRSGKYAQMVGLKDPRGLSAPTPETSALKAYVRESLSLLKLQVKQVQHRKKQKQKRDSLRNDKQV